MTNFRFHPVLLAITKIQTTIFLYLNGLFCFAFFIKTFHLFSLEPVLMILFDTFPSIICILLCNELFEEKIFMLAGFILTLIYPSYLFSYIILIILYYLKKGMDVLLQCKIPYFFDFTIQSTLKVVFTLILLLFGIILKQLPLIKLSLPFFDSATFMILIVFCNCYLFYKGIHPNYIHFFTYPIMYIFLFENIHAYYLGQFIPHLFTHGAMSAFCNLSGTGITIGIALLDHHLPKETLKSALFGVNEPVIFGLPVANHPSTFFPFVVGGTFLGAIPVVLMKLGYLNRPLFEAPYIGLGLEGFLVNFDFRSLFVALIQILLSILIWFPYYRKEKNNEI